jgi:AcrR family transcriptional regulator
MPNFTKAAIKASFLKLLNERPLNQITVKDIVEDCGINRNSFYYHYQDLPSLIEEIIHEETDRIINEYPAIDSIEQCLNVAVRFALDNKRAVLHLYNSVNRSMYERHVMSACEYVVTTYIDGNFPKENVDPEDRDIIIRFYKCACFGQIVDWMTGGMKTDICEQFHRLCELRKGMAEELYRRCTEKNKK